MDTQGPCLQLAWPVASTGQQSNRWHPQAFHLPGSAPHPCLWPFPHVAAPSLALWPLPSALCPCSKDASDLPSAPVLGSLWESDLGVTAGSLRPQTWTGGHLCPKDWLALGRAGEEGCSGKPCCPGQVGYPCPCALSKMQQFHLDPVSALDCRVAGLGNLPSTALTPRASRRLGRGQPRGGAVSHWESR